MLRKGHNREKSLEAVTLVSPAIHHAIRDPVRRAGAERETVSSGLNEAGGFAASVKPRGGERAAPYLISRQTISFLGESAGLIRSL